MSRYSDSDPYLDASGVLKNRLGIADQAVLEQTEADMVAARSFELSQKPLKGRFDLAHANGYYIAWENIEPAALLAASIASFHSDRSQLARLIRENLSVL
jgi:fido (protein-threonine AMPylation protein)